MFYVNSLFKYLSLVNNSFFEMVFLESEYAIKTVPTGLSLVPPDGPAIPLDESILFFLKDKLH